MEHRTETAGASTALSFVHTTTALTRELTNMMQISAAGAAASILLMIFETLEGLETNKLDCERLAHRCFDLLSAIQKQMEGRWDTAPPSLIRNLGKLEKTLTVIHAFMKNEVRSKWHSRLIRKRTIERDLAEFTAQLDDATRSFEMSTLISIHHTIGDRLGLKSQSEAQDTLPPYSPQDTECILADSPTSLEGHRASPVPEKKTSLYSVFTSTSRNSFDIVDRTPESSVFLDDSAVLPMKHTSAHGSEDDGHTPLMDWTLVRKEKKEQAIQKSVAEKTVPFPHITRYHRSQMKIVGRSTIKEGWWAGCVKVNLGTTTVLLKQYDEDIQCQEWDAKMLDILRHRCVPTLAGLSSDGTLPSFILIADEDTRTLQGVVKENIKHNGIDGCTRILLQFYKDLVELVSYLQDQLQISESQIQDYLESASFRATTDGAIYVSPPPLHQDHTFSIRTWNIIDTIHRIIQKALSKVNSTKDSVLQGKVKEVSIAVSKQLSKATADEPCPEWLLLQI